VSNVMLWGHMFQNATSFNPLYAPWY